MQGTQVQALVQEDPTCRGVAGPVCHNCWACAPQLLGLRSRAREPQLLSPRAAATEAHMPRARAPQQEVTAMRSPHTVARGVPRSL